ncbi:MAG: hypothetical protein JWN25_2249 [Verrucomicrobiales bacterium]|nr:hypothetical protein [Verrucomicrobiales bacterium]
MKQAVKFGQGFLILREKHLFELRGGNKADLCMVKEYISLFEHEAVLDIYQ